MLRTCILCQKQLIQSTNTFRGIKELLICDVVTYSGNNHYGIRIFLNNMSQHVMYVDKYRLTLFGKNLTIEDETSDPDLESDHDEIEYKNVSFETFKSLTTINAIQNFLLLYYS